MIKVNETTSETETYLFVGIDENGEDVVAVTTFNPYSYVDRLKLFVLKGAKQITGKVVFVDSQQIN